MCRHGRTSWCAAHAAGSTIATPQRRLLSCLDVIDIERDRPRRRHSTRSSTSLHTAPARAPRPTHQRERAMRGQRCETDDPPSVQGREHVRRAHAIGTPAPAQDAAGASRERGKRGSEHEAPQIARRNIENPATRRVARAIASLQSEEPPRNEIALHLSTTVAANMRRHLESSVRPCLAKDVSTYARGRTHSRARHPGRRWCASTTRGRWSSRI